MEVYCMSEENTSQKERFLQEVEQKLLHRELDARLLEDGLVHVRWNKAGCYLLLMAEKTTESCSINFRAAYPSGPHLVMIYYEYAYFDIFMMRKYRKQPDNSIHGLLFVLSILLIG